MAVVNKGPEKVAVSTFEQKAKQQAPQDATQGKATCSFEARATQEQGTH